MKLTNREIINASAALTALSDEKRNYTFDTKVRYRIFKDLRILQAKAKDVEHEKHDIIRAIAPTTLNIPPNTPEHADFLTKFEKFLDETVEINLTPFDTMTDLKFESNKIHPGVLCDLGPLLLVGEEEPS